MKKIQLVGASNFRDSGGLVTLAGKRVKEGLLYRSDELSKLTESDIKLVEGLGLKTIVDYRGEDERVDNEDKAIKGAKVYCFDPEAKIAAFASGSGLKNNLSEITPEKVYTMMIEQYREFVTSKTAQVAFQQMIKLLVNKDHAPLVQHCRGGKDRTGFGIALVLLLLGVSKEDVVKDYLYTNQCLTMGSEEQLKRLGDNVELIKALSYLKAANEEFLLAALDEIDTTYGGVVSYASNELHISSEEIERLKENYLE